MDIFLLAFAVCHYQQPIFLPSSKFMFPTPQASKIRHLHALCFPLPFFNASFFTFLSLAAPLFHPLRRPHQNDTENDVSKLSM